MTLAAENVAAVETRSITDDAPQEYRFTREEYLQLAAMGLFDAKRVELVSGKIYEMPPQSRPHRVAVSRLIQLLAPQIDTKRFWPNAQATFEIGSWLPEPDFVVMNGTDIESLSSIQDAALVIEVSDSSLTYDLNEKADLYASGGVKELCVFDVRHRKLIVLNEPKTLDDSGRKQQFASRHEFNADDIVSPQFDHAVRIKVGDILPVSF